jgi:GMP synthase-like glutamine amidotransferase
MSTSRQVMLVLQHVDCEPPAAYEDVLIERGIGVERVLLAGGAALPGWRDFAGVIVMGGPMGAYDTAEFAWLEPELALIREAVYGGCPLWGVCLGAQLLAAALGARVWAGPRPEVGVCQVDLTPQAHDDPVFGDLTGPFPALQWHADTFALPDGAVLLASSAQYPNQAFRVNRAYGVQFHVEVDTGLAAQWTEIPAYAHSLATVHGPGSAGTLLGDLDRSLPVMSGVARSLFGNWLDAVVGAGQPAT